MMKEAKEGVFRDFKGADGKLLEIMQQDPSTSQQDAAEILNEYFETAEFNKNKVRKAGIRLGIKFGKKPGPKKDTASIIKFMSKSRTITEMADKGLTKQDLEIEGYKLFETRDNDFVLTYVLLPEYKDLELPKKVWHYTWGHDVETGRWQPYLMIQFPETTWKKLKVVPIADVHYGAYACMVDKFKEYIDWIASRDDVYCFISGDLFENSHGDSNNGISHYEQITRPRDQVDEMTELLAPIANKILWIIPGNHEDRSRTRDYDPSERLAERLGVPYSYEPVFVDINWMGNVFTFYDQHGRSGSQTNGGKINAATKPQEMQDFVHFTIMAHVHDGKVDRTTRIRRDPANLTLKMEKQYVIICPSFFGYFGSYASKAGYKPGSYGSINCDLFAQGDYHANA